MEPKRKKPDADDDDTESKRTHVEESASSKKVRISSSELTNPQDGTGLAANFSSVLKLQTEPNSSTINEDEDQLTEDQIFEFEDAMEAFRVFDNDQTGFISPADLRHVRTIVFSEKFTDEEANEILGEADVNGDGRINYEKFIKMMMA